MRLFRKVSVIQCLEILSVAGMREYEVEVSGVLVIEVSVKGSLVKSEKLIFDTGSKHTWILHSEELRHPDDEENAGFQTALVSTLSATPTDGRDLLYADMSRIRCEMWTRKEFALGDHLWEQKFGIARAQRLNRLPGISGLIGASPKSHFAILHPQFGFRPSNSRDAMKLFLQGIDPSLCVEKRVGYTSLLDDQHWAFKASVRFGTNIDFPDVDVAVDTGASVIGLPKRYFHQFQVSISSSGIRYRYLADKFVGLISCIDVQRFPSFEIVTRDGFKVTIPFYLYIARVDRYTCAVLVARIPDGLPLVFGDH